jgi:nitrogen fixation NifU-like protein
MTKPDPKALYHPLILQHSKAPVHYQKQAEAAHKVEAYNPLCGDRFEVYIALREDRVAELGFYGHGCSVSKASTSVLVEMLAGKTLAEAQALAESFMAMIQQGTPPANEAFAAFVAARDFPGRQSCATLPWQAWLQGARTHFE